MINMNTMSIYFIVLWVSLGHALITGNVIIDAASKIIGKTNVSYTFDLSCQESFQKNGKLTVIFPSDYSFTSSISCQDSSTLYFCTLNSQARLVTLYLGSAFQTTNSISFSVNGVTNPGYAGVETGQFVIRNYKNSNGQYVFIEPSVDTITLTLSPGTLSSGKPTLCFIS